MAQLQIKNIDKSGSAILRSAASVGGDTFDAVKGVMVHAFNENVIASRLITIAAVVDPLLTKEAGSLVVPDVAITIPITDDRIFSVPASHISVAGLISMTYDDETDLTLVALRVAQ